jgi:hypothetical protein
MELSFNLELVLQGVNRAVIADEVWLATRASKGREHDARFRNLCRRLGFGLIAVAASGAVDIILEPFAVTPRRALRPPRRKAPAGWAPSLCEPASASLKKMPSRMSARTGCPALA